MAIRKDPLGNYSYLVEIDGIARAWFSEAGGLDSTIDVIEHREGGENITVRKLPGQVRFSNITLKWGFLDDDRELWEWHRLWATGDAAAARKNGSIVLLDRAGQEKARWNFFNGWPSKWTGPSLSAEAKDIAIESLEIAHEMLTRA